nr:reverse transcriptase domain-containing protein [Tanacetum cinerariifolium]
MSTRSSSRNLFLPLDNPELTIRRRSRVDPTLLNNFKMATEGNGDPPVPDLRPMEELCHPSLNGRGGPIALIAIQATNFGLKNDMIQQVQNSCQFYRLPGDDANDANKHLDKFLHVTQSIKVNGVTNDGLRQYLFPHSLIHHATTWFDRLPRNSINTFEEMAKMFLGKYFPPSIVAKLRNEITNFRQLGTFMKRRPEECYDLIENMTALHNDWDTLAQRSESSSSITSFSDPEIIALKAKMEEINKIFMKVLQINRQVKAVTPSCETCGGPHSYNDCPATIGQTQNVYTAGAYQGSKTLPSNTITNPMEDLNGITTRSGNAYQGPTIPNASSSLPKAVEREIEVTKDAMPPTNNGSTKDVQPPVVQVKTLILNSEPVVTPFAELIVASVNALILMPKFGPTIKSLLTNKDKQYELARTLLNEHCLAVLLKKLPEKLGDPGKFPIPCDFPRMDECLALANLGASINLIPLSVWNKLSLTELTPTLITLELADRSISRPIGVAECHTPPRRNREV